MLNMLLAKQKMPIPTILDPFQKKVLTTNTHTRTHTHTTHKRGGDVALENFTGAEKPTTEGIELATSKKAV